MKDYNVTINFTLDDGLHASVSFRTADICIDEYDDITGALEASESFAQMLCGDDLEYIDYEITSITLINV